MRLLAKMLGSNIPINAAIRSLCRNNEPTRLFVFDRGYRIGGRVARGRTPLARFAEIIKVLAKPIPQQIAAFAHCAYQLRKDNIGDRTKRSQKTDESNEFRSFPVLGGETITQTVRNHARTC
jgi:hypothetical protein